MIEKITARISKIRVRLPNNPLKNLNVHVVFGDKRNLLIDTGFNLPETFEDLSAGVAALELDMTNTDIFLTHCHADHTGLVAKIAAEDTRIYISEQDQILSNLFVRDPVASRKRLSGKHIEAGFPEREMNAALDASPALRNVSSEAFCSIAIPENYVFDLGGVQLQTIATPGHSPGHMCLYIPEDQILFTGDHVLFDISPNITDWPEMSDPLGSYLDSLEKTKNLNVKLALPAHRETGAFYDRIEYLFLHHAKRMTEIENLLRVTPGLTCYEIASKMTWKIRNNNWSDFPLSQKTFAVGEAMAHLIYLELRGRVAYLKREGVLYYHI